jgi:thymidylate kinase
VIVELIGPSGAGKSTLARALCTHLGGPGRAAVASDLVLDQPMLRRIRNATAANVVQDLRGLPYLARAAPHHADVLRLAARMLVEDAPSRFDLVMNARSVMRRIGMYELARHRAAGRVVLIDEGPVLIAYHLFVYSTADPAGTSLDRFAATVPLPDRVIYVRSPVAVLAERACSRPDRRRQLAGMTPNEAEAPLLRALQVFDRLVSTPRLQERTLVVDNGSQDPAALSHLAAELAVVVRSWADGPPAQGGPARPAVVS